MSIQVGDTERTEREAARRRITAQLHPPIARMVAAIGRLPAAVASHDLSQIEAVVREQEAAVTAYLAEFEDQ